MSYDSSKNKGTGYGKKGGDSRVSELQRALNAAGFTDGKGKKLDVDGMLGPLTTAAIKKAQTALGMKPTGKVNADFIKQLKKRKGGKARVGAKQDVKTNARKPRVGAHQDTKRTSKSKPKKFHVAAVKTSKRFSATTRAEKSNRREAVEYDDEQLELMVELLATLTPNRLDEIGDLADGYLAELGVSAQEATAAGAPPGSGANFKALAAKVGSPALAAYIGRKKYGKKKFQALAAAHRRRKTREGVEVTVEAVTHGGGRVTESLGVTNTGNRVYRVRIIQYGDSRNKRRYPESVMRAAASKYEGAKAYDHHRSDEELRTSTTSGLVGWYESVEAKDDGLYADLHLLPGAKGIAEALDATLDLQQRGLPPLVGTSHDITGNFRPVNVNGRVVQEAISIKGVSSVDIVANPAAGGQAVRAVAGGDDTDEEELMEPEKLAEALAGLTDEQLAAAGLSRAVTENEDGDTDLNRIVEADVPDALDKNSIMGKIAIKAMLDDAKIDGRFLEGVLEALPDYFIEDDVTAQIKQLKNVYATLERAELIPKAPQPGEGVAKEALDKKREALDAFFNSDFGKGYWSFRQAYCDFTGNQPKSFDEDFNRTILRESIGAQSFDSRQRATEAMDSTSWNLVLGDSITRKMVAEYAMPSLSNWRTIVSSTVPVNDFRTQRIDRIGGYGTLPAVNQGAAYQPLTSPDDEEVTYAITKRGGTEEITLEMIANDDVRSIARIPVKLGRAAAQTLYRFVWEMVNPATNAAIYDGDTLYHSNHGNTNSTALSAAQLSAVRQKMRDQAAYGSSLDILSLVPKILVVPNELEELAFEIVTSSVAMPSGAPVGAASDIPNLHQGLQLIVMDYWTDANNWVVIADPSMCPTIEMGFYQGRDTPELFTQSDPTQGSMFDADKLTYKIRHIYSGTVLDYRGFQGSIVT
jgi:hypothetical protein